MVLELYRTAFASTFAKQFNAFEWFWCIQTYPNSPNRYTVWQQRSIFWLLTRKHWELCDIIVRYDYCQLCMLYDMRVYIYIWLHMYMYLYCVSYMMLSFTTWSQRAVPGTIQRSRHVMTKSWSLRRQLLACPALRDRMRDAVCCRML